MKARETKAILRVTKINSKARHLNGRLTKCTETGKIIIVRNKPCQCSATKVKQWRHELDVARRQRTRIEVRVNVNKARETKAKLQKRITICKKTGQVIIEKKVCSCNAKTVARWNVRVQKQDKKILVIKREAAKREAKIVKLRVKTWETRAATCKKAKIIVVRGQQCSCKRVKAIDTKIRIHARVVKLENRKVVIQDRIRRCDKTGKVITITVNQVPKKCGCTAGKVNRWKV